MLLEDLKTLEHLAHPRLRSGLHLVLSDLEHLDHPEPLELHSQCLEHPCYLEHLDHQEHLVHFLVLRLHLVNPEHLVHLYDPELSLELQ